MFRFVCRGWNCAEYINDCMLSLIAQTRTDWTATLMIDPSADDTAKIAGGFAERDRHIQVFANNNRMGVCYNMWWGIKNTLADPEDVICIVDLDDCLPYYALETVCNTYIKHPNTLCTYGSFVMMDTDKVSSICKSYAPNARPRKEKWHGSHLKTFKAKIFDHIPQGYFMYEDKWGSGASDLALMFSVMEVAGMENCRFIKTPTYIYRNNSPITCNRGTQKKWANRFRAKKPLARVF